jgi:RNA polymerase sigma factor (TIGR02999 family)
MDPKLTQILLEARDGHATARERLFGAAYPQLRQLASAQLRRHASGSTLHTTALVNEAYLKLFDQTQLASGDRVQFFGIAGRAMRQILVDHYRRASAKKRGGEVEHLDLEDQQIPADMPGEMLLALDEALHRLEEMSPRLAKVVESRFFGGMTETEIAQLIGVTDRTVRSDWRKAKAWLAQELGPGSAA